LTSPKDVLDLGESIVRHLQIDDRGAILDRWLAHHLAEMLSNVQQATGTEKEAAEGKAVDLVLKLWSHRRALPEAADPLGGYRDAIAVLGRLVPDANPWARYRGSQPKEHLLRELFTCMSKAVLGGILLSHLSRPRPTTPAEKKALQKEELILLEAMEAWMPFASPDAAVPDIRVVIMDAGTDTPETEVQKPEQPKSSGGDENLEESIRAVVTDNLELIQQRLAELTQRWKDAGTSPDEA
jgi:hypothetical protein